jgi:two-component sensor histidine kinase
MLRVRVTDDGRGLPEAVEEGLGLQIVRSLIEQDLRGRLTMDVDGGTAVMIEVETTG